MMLSSPFDPHCDGEPRVDHDVVFVALVDEAVAVAVVVLVLLALTEPDLVSWGTLKVELIGTHLQMSYKSRRIAK